MEFIVLSNQDDDWKDCHVNTLIPTGKRKIDGTAIIPLLLLLRILMDPRADDVLGRNKASAF